MISQFVFFSGNGTVPCSGRGQCVCGKCVCNPGYGGSFCDCDNLACDYTEDGICGGQGLAVGNNAASIFTFFWKIISFLSVFLTCTIGSEELQQFCQKLCSCLHTRTKYIYVVTLYRLLRKIASVCVHDEENKEKKQTRSHHFL